MSEQKRGCGYRKGSQHKHWKEPAVSILDLSYLAGLIDGDGSMSISKRDRMNRGTLSFSVMVKIAGDTAHISDLQKQYAIGNIWIRKKAGMKHLAEWSISGNQARWILKSVMPFLRLKREQAKIAVSMPQCQSRWDGTLELRDRQKLCYQELQFLNNKSRRRGN